MIMKRKLSKQLHLKKNMLAQYLQSLVPLKKLKEEASLS